MKDASMPMVHFNFVHVNEIFLINITPKKTFLTIKYVSFLQFLAMAATLQLLIGKEKSLWM